MGYAVAADAIVLLHALFILFALLGGLLVARGRGWMAVHLPALAWAAWIGIAGATCPLTPLENHFRALAGRTPYGGGFIAHYLLGIIYPAGLTHRAQLVLTLGLIVVNVAAYSWALPRSRR